MKGEIGRASSGPLLAMCVWELGEGISSVRTKLALVARY